MTGSSGGGNAQFTYDFGIAISQSVISKITKLTGVTLTLASAFYALQNTSAQYVKTIRENTLRMGGQLSAIKAMNDAASRIVEGKSYFSVDDQLNGMHRLMSVGLKVKENLDWINKAAHATGQSFSQFSGAITSAIQGNMGQLVEMGLMTQRATRMFDKYAANTVMRQQAIMNFLKGHKGLLSAIKNDFETVQDQILRIKAVWAAFLKSVVGMPNDPSSLYGQVVRAFKIYAEGLSKTVTLLKRMGFVIGQVLGWVVHQVGNFILYIGKVCRKTFHWLESATKNYAEFTRSLIVWLEFMKLKLIDIFKQYKDEILTVVKLIILFKTLKFAFDISKSAVNSVLDYKDAIMSVFNLQSRYIRMQGPFISKTARIFQSFAVFLPKTLRKSWVALGKAVGNFFALDFGKYAGALGKLFTSPFKMLNDILSLTSLSIIKLFRGDFVGAAQAFVTIFLNSFGKIGSAIMRLPSIAGAALNIIRGLFTALNATNPVGWVILAVTAVVLLYKKFGAVRVLVNAMFKAWWEYVKVIWNLVYGACIGILVFIKKIWITLGKVFSSAKKWIGSMWAAFCNTGVGKFIDKYIVSPLKTLFEWIMKGLRWLLKGAATILSVINDKLADKIREGEKELGMEHSFAAKGGGEINMNDDTDYLSMDGLFGKNKKDTKETLPANPVSDASAMGGVSKTITNALTFTNGAIQIVVDKGASLNENKLAQKIKEVLLDLQREGNMRGGTA